MVLELLYLQKPRNYVIHETEAKDKDVEMLGIQG